MYMYTPKISDTYEHSVITVCQKKSDVMGQKSWHLLYSYFIEQHKYTLYLLLYYIYVHTQNF